MKIYLVKKKLLSYKNSIHCLNQNAKMSSSIFWQPQISLTFSCGKSDNLLQLFLKNFQGLAPKNLNSPTRCSNGLMLFNRKILSPCLTMPFKVMAISCASQC